MQPSAKTLHPRHGCKRLHLSLEAQFHGPFDEFLAQLLAERPEGMAFIAFEDV